VGPTKLPCASWLLHGQAAPDMTDHIDGFALIDPNRSVALDSVGGAGWVLVGHQPCSCRGGHTSWFCLECGAVVYVPPVDAGCRVLDGPATVRG
jgi:hypothetical protein